MTGTRVVKLKHGEHHLRDVGSVTITLANGKNVEFWMDSELSIPRDGKLIDHAIQAPARLAFWGAQLARVSKMLEKRKADLKEEIGVLWIGYRTKMERGDLDGVPTEFGLISALVDSTTSVVRARREIVALQYEVDMVRTIYAAVEQRCYMIRKAMSANPDATGP